MFYTISTKGTPSEGYICPIGSGATQQREAYSNRQLVQTVSEKTLSGAATTNGLYIVTVEKKLIRLVCLKGIMGGVCCETESLNWAVRFKDTKKFFSGVSVRVRCLNDRLFVTAVDTTGAVHSKVLHVDGLQEPQPPQPMVLQGTTDDNGIVAF